MQPFDGSADTDELVLLKSISQFLTSPICQTLIQTHPNRVACPDFIVPPEWRSWWDWAGTLPDIDVASQQRGEPKWIAILQYYMGLNNVAVGVDHERNALGGGVDGISSIPQDLKALLDMARRLQLSRQPGPARPLLESSMNPDDYPYQIPVNGKLSEDVEKTVLARTPPSILMSEDERSRGAGWAHGMSPKKAHEVRQMSLFTAELLAANPKLRRVKHVVDVGAGQVRDAHFL